VIVVGPPRLAHVTGRRCPSSTAGLIDTLRNAPGVRGAFDFESLTRIHTVHAGLPRIADRAMRRGVTAGQFAGFLIGGELQPGNAYAQVERWLGEDP
jgi:hypothetical protein